MFAYALPKVLKSLLLSSPEIETLPFSRNVKKHIILIQPLRMLPLHDASILQLIIVDLIPLLCTEFIFIKLFSLIVAMAP